jgi:hypothetical protein
MSDDFDAFMKQLEFRPAAPEWRTMTAGERTLAAFADAMREAVTDGMENVASCSDEDVLLYCAAFEAIGVGWVASELNAVRNIPRGSVAAQNAMAALSRRVDARWSELWGAAEAFARTQNLFPREES